MASKANRKRIWVGVAAATIAFLGIGIGIAGAAEPKDKDYDEDEPPQRDRDPDDRPLVPDPNDDGIRGKIDIAICDCVESGVTGEDAVTRCVAVEIWADFPWPPIEGDHFSHWDAWGMIRDRVDDYITATLAGTGGKWCDRARGIKVVAKPMPTKPDDGISIPEKTDIPDLDLSDFESPTNHPRDGIFHQNMYGEILLGSGSRSITYRALGSAGYLAAKENGATEAEALEFGREVSKNSSRRLEYLNLIQCSPWNDALYTTWGYGDVAWPPGGHGRALRLLKFHPDNRQRIIDRLPPMRNIRLGDPSWRTKDPPRRAGPEWTEAAKAFEYLWLPKLDYTALFNDLHVTLDPTPWEGADDNMSSKIFPPPLVSNLDAMNVPSGLWGCPGLPLLET